MSAVWNISCTGVQRVPFRLSIVLFPLLIAVLMVLVYNCNYKRILHVSFTVSSAFHFYGIELRSSTERIHRFNKKPVDVKLMSVHGIPAV